MPPSKRATRFRTRNEEDQLTDYVLDYFSHLATQFEKDLMLSLNLDHKAVFSDSPMMRHKLGEKRDEIIARISNPEVLALLPLGPHEIHRRIRERILRDHSDEIYLNRCPTCHRLLRTPVAKMCIHCGNAWHDQVSSQ